MHMKKILAIIILATVCALCAKGQTVYSVQYKSEADVKVYVAKYKSEADLVVYKCKYKSEADLVIWFAEYKSEAGWQKKEKQHLMY